MVNCGLYAEPKEVPDIRACLFYHTMDVPGHARVDGDWDLRRGIDRYLGRTPFQGKRVLDVGSASGFLSFHMERQGAEVVSYDLSDEYLWDFVPFAGVDFTKEVAGYRDRIRRLDNGYWFGHHAYRSRARKVYGTVYRSEERRVGKECRL